MGRGKFGIVIYYWIFIIGSLMALYFMGLANDNGTVIKVLVCVTLVYLGAVGSYQLALSRKGGKNDPKDGEEGTAAAGRSAGRKDISGKGGKKKKKKG